MEQLIKFLNEQIETCDIAMAKSESETVACILSSQATAYWAVKNFIEENNLK